MTTLKIPSGGVSIPGSDYPGGAEIVETNEEIIGLLKAAGATEVKAPRPPVAPVAAPEG